MQSPGTASLIGPGAAGLTPWIACVESDLPTPSEYYENLVRAHRLNRYSNFGDIVEELSSGLLEAFGLAGEACVTCNSATAGLSAALIASRINGPVLVPGFTFPATYGAVRAAGMTPLVMDVNSETWSIAPDRLDALLATTGAEAVILVAPFGISTDFSEHVAVCRKHSAITVIDCAAGLGVKRNLACDEPDLFEVFSLHATKPLGIGEGGLVLCAPDTAPLIRSALNFGIARPPLIGELKWGFNGKLSELHAAVGLAQLQRFKPLVDGRQRFASLYNKLLAKLPVAFPKVSPAASPWQVFPVLLPTEGHVTELTDAMQANGIEVRRYYHPSLSNLDGAVLAEPCPVSEHLASHMIALPIRSIAHDFAAEPILSPIRSALSTVFSVEP